MVLNVFYFPDACDFAGRVQIEDHQRLFGIAADLGLQIFQHLIRVQTGNAVLQKSLPQPFPVPGPLPRQRIINELFWRLYAALLYENLVN